MTAIRRGMDRRYFGTFRSEESRPFRFMQKNDVAIIHFLAFLIESESQTQAGPAM